MINIFILDDHPIYIKGIKAALQPDKKIVKVIGSATSAPEAMQKLTESPVDVILLDLIMPEIDGIECAHMIKKQYPGMKIVILTGENDTQLLYNAWIAGVDAILTKYCGKGEIIATIKSVIEGNRIIGKKLPDFFSHMGGDDSSTITLTSREQQVLSLLAQGKRRVDVSDLLNISKDTVDFHCRNLHRKFDKNKIQSVISEARKAKLIR